MQENKENKTEGFTKFDNGLIKAIYKCNRITLSELRIVLFIIYQTIGYHREQRSLTINYIANGTGIPYWTVQKALKSLLKKDIVIVKSENKIKNMRSFQINTNYEKWVGSDYSVAEKGKVVKTAKVAEKAKVNLLPDPCNNSQGGLAAKSKGVLQQMATNKRKIKTIKIKSRKSSVDTTDKATPPPTMNEVISFCQDKGYSFSGEKFFYHYQSLGWTYNGQPIRDWRALADKWQTTEKSYSLIPTEVQPPKKEKAAYDIEDYENYSMFDSDEYLKPIIRRRQ